MKQGRVAPWLYLLPALVLMTIYIIYPGLLTFYLSLRNQDSSNWATTSCAPGTSCWGIFENYHYALISSTMVTAILNNIIWILLMVTGTVGLGLLVATLADRVRYESVAKSIIFLPMAISFVGAGIIWGFVYNYQSGSTQIGLLNAIWTALGGQPQAWLTAWPRNTVALIAVGIWIWTGFCMTIIAAALRSVPTELLEAARVDGATEWRVFWSIIIPLILPTLAVVITTMVINVLKIFDLVYVMTGGNYSTQVIAYQMYREQYTNFQTGRASAIATVLILLIVPAMFYNIKRFQEQEAIR
jgi:alpha-glucoside transport system permease protein